MDGDVFHPIAVHTPIDPEALGDFFAPVERPKLVDLINACDQLSDEIESTSKMANNHLHRVMHHFLEGNIDQERRMSHPPVAKLFDAEGAKRSLWAYYWSKALELTDVFESMPEARRNEWNEQIRSMKTPSFDADTVIPTIQELLMSRERFLSERVDGIFRNLSRTHVTNRPEGFSKRMILDYMMSYSSLDYRRMGHIYDLRCVIAKLQRTPVPGYTSSTLLERLLKSRIGQWVEFDGGALKLRLYKKGTVHIEVHPDMAWKLNAILASLYPQAIPGEYRKRPRERQYKLLQETIPFPIREAIYSGISRCGTRVSVCFQGDDNAKQLLARASAVLESLGATRIDESSTFKTVEYSFERDMSDIVAEVMASGVLPEKVTHQFYPTPDAMVALAHEALSAGRASLGKVLEPSAGNGALINGIDPAQVTAIDISELRVKILAKQGVKALCFDFMEWASDDSFDSIVMNPPFSSGRARLHLEKALCHLAPKGRLVAILPAGFEIKNIPPHIRVEITPPIKRPFPDASIDVVLLTANRN